jgi:hypothetical protein
VKAVYFISRCSPFFDAVIYIFRGSFSHLFVPVLELIVILDCLRNRLCSRRRPPSGSRGN